MINPLTCSFRLPLPCSGVTEAEAVAIRAVFQQRGELSAVIELRRRFPGIAHLAQARECAWTIAGWPKLRPIMLAPKVPRLRRQSGDRSSGLATG